MSRSMDLEGVQGSTNMLDFECVPGCRRAQISDEQRGAVEEDEVATGVHGVLHLRMGIATENRCE